MWCFKEKGLCFCGYIMCEMFFLSFVFKGNSKCRFCVSWFIFVFKFKVIVIGNVLEDKNNF